MAEIGKNIKRCRAWVDEDHYLKHGNNASVAPISYYKTHVFYFTQIWDSKPVLLQKHMATHDMSSLLKYHFSPMMEASILCSIIVMVIQVHAYLDASVSYCLRSSSFFAH